MLFSLAGTWLTLNHQTRRETQAQERLAVGTARVMIGAFDNGVRYLCRLGDDGFALLDLAGVPSSVGTADRELVAGELDPDEALTVAEGDQAMANWEESYENLRAAGTEDFDAYARGLDRGIERAIDAREALEETAGFQDTESEPCDFRKRWGPRP